MKRLAIKVFLFTISLGLAGIFGLIYWGFHEPRSWQHRSPLNSSWAVDVIPAGFVDLAQQFRVHDFSANPFRPRFVCDLYWENIHQSKELNWSKDGSIAAIVVEFAGHGGKYYGCAYNFATHEIFRSTAYSGSPLEASTDFTTEIEKLIAAHGGLGATVSLPDATKSL